MLLLDKIASRLDQEIVGEISFEFFYKLSTMTKRLKVILQEGVQQIVWLECFKHGKQKIL